MLTVMHSHSDSVTFGNPERIPHFDVDALCVDRIGAYSVCSRRTGEHRDSETWRLVGSRRCAYLKLHRRPEKWAAEVHAYERWVPTLGSDAPQLLGLVEQRPWALLLSEVPGQSLECQCLSIDLERRVWNSAGSVLRRIHALPPGRCFGIPSRNGEIHGRQCCDDPTRYMASALTVWLEQGIAQRALDALEIEVARAALDGVEVFADQQPTVCHGDFRPRNWIIGRGGEWLGVVDFEHMRWDLPMVDIGLWWDRIPATRRDLGDALLAGYGIGLEHPWKEQLHIVRVFAALARIIGGSRSGHRDVEKTGRLAIHKIAGDVA